eukprot:TRINITY_DN276_c1_g1_i1.p1 TRINITY_DN276_c1_g1~~TRINITY_DN276_c1_g1_i1.p1  ORF type:complete len:240 (+),score=13.52 TRINITY_DN276_c1_g1_i1:222-941(+)
MKNISERIEIKTLLIEFLATYIFVFLGSGSSALYPSFILIPALVHSLVLFVINVNISNKELEYYCHMNPAKSLSSYLMGDIKTFQKTISLIFIQFFASCCASFSLVLVLYGIPSNLGVTVYTSKITSFRACMIEMTLTLIIVVISGLDLSSSDSLFKSFCEPFMVFICFLIGGDLTGASFNPVRSFGPSFITGNYSHLWVYILGPTLGFIIGSLITKYLKDILISQHHLNKSNNLIEEP